MNSPEHIKRRRELVRKIEAMDKDRFQPSPLGPGYLSRYQRYTELFRQLSDREQDRAREDH